MSGSVREQVGCLHQNAKTIIRTVSHALHAVLHTYTFEPSRVLLLHELAHIQRKVCAANLALHKIAEEVDEVSGWAMENGETYLGPAQDTPLRTLKTQP